MSGTCQVSSIGGARDAEGSAGSSRCNMLSRPQLRVQMRSATYPSLEVTDDRPRAEQPINCFDCPYLH
jgi:hypothetical protein